MKKCGFMFLCFFLVGCASHMTGSPQKQLTRYEWLNIKSRYYESVAPDQIFTATEKLFKLADEGDVRFSYDANSLTAIRWAAPFPINIWYHWTIVTNPIDNGTKVMVSIQTTAHGFGVPGGMSSYDSIDVFRLFFSRLDYLIGKSSKWLSCDEYEQENPEYTSLEALCMLANDLTPSSP